MRKFVITSLSFTGMSVLNTTSSFSEEKSPFPVSAKYTSMNRFMRWNAASSEAPKMPASAWTKLRTRTTTVDKLL